MAALSAIRLRDDAVDVRWVLFIDGIQYAFSNDNGQGRGSVLGSGASSWIGRSETSIGGVEVTGARTVLAGLELPRTFGEAVDEKSSQAERRQMTFRLHDEDGTLASLFGRENKEFDVLGHRIAAGTTAVAATGIGAGGALIGLRDRWIGLEKTGTAGQRRLFPCLPETLVGMEHSVLQDAAGPDALPPIKVSDEPIQHVGRLVTLYLVYRDPDDSAEDATAWPTWNNQDTAGNRQWVGKILGVRRQRGRVWEIQCHGRDGLFRKQCGRISTSAWHTVSTELSAGPGEDEIGVYFQTNSIPGSEGAPRSWNSLGFQGGGVSLSATTKGALATEINGVIEDVIDGTTTNWAGFGNLDTWNENAIDQDPDAGMTGGTPATLFVRKTDSAVTEAKVLRMMVALHAKYWQQLGFEPANQDHDIRNGADNARQIRFRELENGQPWRDFGGTVPAAGYWEAEVGTQSLGFSQDAGDVAEWANKGLERHYEAKFLGEPFTLEMVPSNQLVRLGSQPFFVEGQLELEVSGDDVDGNASEHARYWAIRGKVLTSPEEDPIDTVQVAKLEWADDNYGSMSPGSGAQPAAILTQWMDPRLFGFPFEPLADDLDYWTGVAGDEGQVDATPLHNYAYVADDIPEFAWHVWGQVLLSTGSGGGVSGGILTEGANSPGLAGTYRWFSDIARADNGCAIPYQLVASAATVRGVFDEVPGGVLGDLQRVRYAYSGPYLAQDLLESIMRCRSLMWSYHGDVLGVVRLAPFSPLEADVTISEADLYGDDDPRSLMAEERPNPAGALDGIDLTYRWRPDESKMTHSLRALSRDAEAQSRTGELIEQLHDHGLIDPATFRDLGLGSWRDEMEALWAVDRAEFFSLDHKLITLTVSRPKGQDLRPGTKVTVSNPWISDNAGGYGLTDVAGLVVSREVDTRTHATKVGIFVFAGQGQGWPFFAPMARVVEQSGAILTLSSDQYGHGNSQIADGNGFSAPSWTSASASRDVVVLYRIGETFAIDGSYTVSTWNASSNQLTLTTTPTTSIEYADRWVILDNYDDQGNGTYPRAVFGPVVIDELTHGSVPSVGQPFLV